MSTYSDIKNFLKNNAQTAATSIQHYLPTANTVTSTGWKMLNVITFIPRTTYEVGVTIGRGLVCDPMYVLAKTTGILLPFIWFTSTKGVNYNIYKRHEKDFLKNNQTVFPDCFFNNQNRIVCTSPENKLAFAKAARDYIFEHTTFVADKNERSVVRFACLAGLSVFALYWSSKEVLQNQVVNAPDPVPAPRR